MTAIGHELVRQSHSVLFAAVSALAERTELVTLEGDSYRLKEAKERAEQKAKKRTAQRRKKKST